jgi:hypothetical protein
MESRFILARRSLFWRTERRTRITAVEGRRRRGGADWLGSGVTESNSRSEQNQEGYKQARDFHLLAPCRGGGYGGLYNAAGHGWVAPSQVVGITENEIGKISL